MCKLLRDEVSFLFSFRDGGLFHRAQMMCIPDTFCFLFMRFGWYIHRGEEKARRYASWHLWYGIFLK